jgi:hypothetical protein
VTSRPGDSGGDGSKPEATKAGGGGGGDGGGAGPGSNSDGGASGGSNAGLYAGIGGAVAAAAVVAALIAFFLIKRRKAHGDSLIDDEGAKEVPVELGFEHHDTEYVEEENPYAETIVAYGDD